MFLSELCKVEYWHWFIRLHIYINIMKLRYSEPCWESIIRHLAYMMDQFCRDRKTNGPEEILQISRLLISWRSELFTGTIVDLWLVSLFCQSPTSVSPRKEKLDNVITPTNGFWYFFFFSSRRNTSLEPWEQSGHYETGNSSLWFHVNLAEMAVQSQSPDWTRAKQRTCSDWSYLI